MKKIIIISLLLVLITSNITFADDVNIVGESALLIDLDTGQVLYEKDPHLRLYPASTTKIMTGILAIELGDMDDIVTVDEEVVSLTEGSHIALEPGEQLLFKDLLYALLVESANDSANVIAKHISGTIEEFVVLMNNKAKELGAVDTNFVNPNGLHDENHYTTAYDLSLIANYAMKNETFREVVSTYTYTIPVTNKKNEERYLWSTNKLLYGTNKIYVDNNYIPVKYDGVTGVKTGYTSDAGNCLVATAERDNRNLMALVLKSQGNEVFADIHKLLNYGFGNFNNVNIAFKNQFIDNHEIENGTIPLVSGVLKDNLMVSLPKDSMGNITDKVIFDEETIAPTKKGQSIGKVEYYLEDELLGSVDIVSTMDVEEIPRPSIFQLLIDRWYILLIVGFIVVKIFTLKYRRKKRRSRREVYKSPY